MECSFDFPVTANCIVSKLVACIGDRVVECNIRDRDKAKQKYDDAIAAGNAAVLGDKKKNAVSIKIGNLLPGETAIINVGLLEDLKIEGGAWAYSVPSSFFPNYSKHSEAKSIDILPYKFGYEIKILAGDKIMYLSAPSGSDTKFNADKSEATITGQEIGKQLRVFYRSFSMQVPRLLYEENPNFPDEVAVLASFVPTFEPVEP